MTPAVASVASKEPLLDTIRAVYQPIFDLCSGAVVAHEALSVVSRLTLVGRRAEAVEVGTEDIARLNPALCLDEVTGGVFCPTDGFLRPLQLPVAGVHGTERRSADGTEMVRALPRRPARPVRPMR